MGGYFSAAAAAYDEPHGGDWLPHEYFVKRGQGDLHVAWLWLRYIATLESAPWGHRGARAAYDRHQHTAEFRRFCAWMGGIG
jgi:hypothetical protein